VTRDGKRPLTVLVAVLLLAASVGACGDSDSSDSTGATATGATTTAQGNDAERSEGGSEGRPQSQGKGGDGSHSDGGKQDQGKGSRSQNVAVPLKVSGGGSAQFRVKGGDNSVQEYGAEGSESELQEVAETVHSFYVAQAEERWEEACSYLAQSNVESLERLAAQAPQLRRAGCGAILAAFTRPLPASLEREITTVDAGSFRHEGEQGFLIYYGGGGTIYSMPMREEDGSWKVAALSGSAIG